MNIVNYILANSYQKFGRLSVIGTVLSKRKIIKLIENGCVRGWDDPRLYTLIALRRRGVPPGAILAFVNELGVTKAKTTIDIKRYEQVVRKYLETTVPRLMLLLDPLIRFPWLSITFQKITLKWSSYHSLKTLPLAYVLRVLPDGIN